MAKLPYKNHYNYEIQPGEKNDLPSLTVPGETMSIAQLMERAMAGSPIVGNNYEYLDSEDVDMIDKFFAPGALDLTDIAELPDKVDRLREKVEEGIKAKEEAAKEEAVRIAKQRIEDDQSTQEQASKSDTKKSQE